MNLGLEAKCSATWATGVVRITTDMRKTFAFNLWKMILIWAKLNQHHLNTCFSICILVIFADTECLPSVKGTTALSPEDAAWQLKIIRHVNDKSNKSASPTRSACLLLYNISMFSQISWEYVQPKVFCVTSLHLQDKEKIRSQLWLVWKHSTLILLNGTHSFFRRPAFSFSPIMTVQWIHCISWNLVAITVCVSYPQTSAY